MTSKEYFMNKVALQCNGRKEHRKSLTLPLKIDLARAQGSTSCPYLTSPSTSMLSPLSPKLRSPLIELTSPSSGDNHRRLSVSKTEHTDPIVDSDTVLHLIDLTSPLGQRIIKALKELAYGPFSICHNYEEYCNTNPKTCEEPPRILRSYHADHSSNYMKRINHKHLNRPYLFSKLDKCDRKKVLSTGLSARSRKLLRAMKKCYVILNRLPTISTTPHAGDKAVVKTCHVELKIMPCVVLPRNFNNFQSGIVATEMLKTNNNECQSTPLHATKRSDEHRKSVRLRRSPKRLIHSF